MRRKSNILATLLLLLVLPPTQSHGALSQEIRSTDNQETPLSVPEAYVIGGTPSPIVTDLPNWKVKNYYEIFSLTKISDTWSEALLGQENQNIVVRKKYTKPVVDIVQVAANAEAFYNASVTYYDGLGFIKQQVEQNANPEYNDLITPYKHDLLGREDVWSYLPYPESTPDNNKNRGRFRENGESEAEAWHGSDAPYTYKEYEKAVNGRVVSRSLPGMSISTVYHYDVTNPSVDKVLDIKPGLQSGTLVVSTAFRATGSLFKNAATDEDGRIVETFVDGVGNTLLERRLSANAQGQKSVLADTYYVYDEFNRIMCVITPEGSKLLKPGTTYNIANSSALVSLSYFYKYDDKGRLASKKTPDKDWEYYVYDRDNRLVMYQDANMRAYKIHKWIEYQYDSMGRLSAQYLLTNTDSELIPLYTRDAWQARWDENRTYSPVSGLSFTQTMACDYDTRMVSKKEKTGTISIKKECILGVYGSKDTKWEFGAMDNNRRFFDENNVIREEFYIGSLSHIFGIYDDRIYYYVPTECYAMINDICTNLAPYSWGLATNSIANLGLPGITKGVIDVTDYTGMYYAGRNERLMFKAVEGVVSYQDIDSRTKGLKTYESLAVIAPTGLSSDKIERCFFYDSKGRVLQRVELSTEGISRYSMAYDHTGNLLSLVEQHHRAGVASPDTKHVNYSYDHRGRLLSEKTNLNGVNGSVDYRYDGVGKVTSKRIAGTKNAQIMQNYTYNICGWLTTVGVTNRFTQRMLYRPSGNIDKTIYNVFGKGDYTNTYSYDNMGRQSNVVRNSPKGVSETLLSYDANGNITSLTQRMKSGSSYRGRIQTYTYFGNKIDIMVKNDYRFNKTYIFNYDDNGNMIHNGSRSLGLNYNYLNLLSSAERYDIGKSASYSWLADGSKVRVESVTGGVKSGYLYRGSLSYDLGSNEVSTSFAGGVLMQGLTTGSAGVSLLHVTDHLGSVRVIVSSGNNSVYNDYEPFGEIDTENSVNNSLNLSASGDYKRWKFNGMEAQVAGDVGLLDYGARMYDTNLGRWMSPDPLAEAAFDTSPYAYCRNNPMNRIDPTGAADIWYYDANGKKIGNDGNMSDNRRMIITNNKEARSISKTEGAVPLSSVQNGVMLPSDAVLNESLDVLSRTIGNGGRSEESSIVMNDGFVVRGERGAEYKEGDTQLSAQLPDLPTGYSLSDLEATIHSHMTDEILVDGEFKTGNASKRGDGDATPFALSPTNVIVGRLGAPVRTTLPNGTYVLQYRPFGAAIYNRERERKDPILTLEKRVIQKILTN